MKQATNQPVIINSYLVFTALLIFQQHFKKQQTKHWFEWKTLIAFRIKTKFLEQNDLIISSLKTDLEGRG